MGRLRPAMKSGPVAAGQRHRNSVTALYPLAEPVSVQLKNSAFHTNTDTRSSAPARRDEDRVIRPLTRFRFQRTWPVSPGQYHLSVLLFNCRRESPYWNGITP